MPSIDHAVLLIDQSLHVAMKEYALAVNEFDKNKAFSQVSLLLSQGKSPYSKNTIPLDAFEHAINSINPDWQEWRLYACILQHTKTKTSFANQLKAELITYCHNSTKEVNSSFWNFFHNSNTKKLRMKQVASLTKTLSEVGQTSSNAELLNNALIISQSFSFLDGSKLAKLLNRAITSEREKQTGNTTRFFNARSLSFAERRELHAEYLYTRFPG